MKERILVVKMALMLAATLVVVMVDLWDATKVVLKVFELECLKELSAVDGMDGW